jgi:hypothetical protein
LVVVAVVVLGKVVLVVLVALVVEVKVLILEPITQSLVQLILVVAVVDLQETHQQDEMVLQVDQVLLLFVTQFKRELKHGTFC